MFGEEGEDLLFDDHNIKKFCIRFFWNPPSCLKMVAQEENNISNSCKSGKVAKPRAILTSEQAVAIFELRPSASDPKTRKTCSAVLARKYGVGEKTVRDIWCGRTWHEETQHLDPSRPARKSAPPGRPLGRKDTAAKQFTRSSDSNQAEISETPSKLFEDPFHDDWPNWQREEAFCDELIPPVIIFKPLAIANVVK